MKSGIAELAGIALQGEKRNGSSTIGFESEDLWFVIGRMCFDVFFPKV